MNRSVTVKAPKMEYQTTIGRIGPNREDPRWSQELTPQPPFGQGWDLKTSVLSGEMIYWFWSRDSAWRNHDDF